MGHCTTRWSNVSKRWSYITHLAGSLSLLLLKRSPVQQQLRSAKALTLSLVRLCDRLKFRWEASPGDASRENMAMEIGSTVDTRGACMAKSRQRMRLVFFNGDGWNSRTEIYVAACSSYLYVLLPAKHVGVHCRTDTSNVNGDGWNSMSEIYICGCLLQLGSYL
jgi:hypothetical protein